MTIKVDSLKCPTRKSPRMKHYDYSMPGYYFLTFCTHQKACLFGNPGQTNAMREIAEEGIHLIPQHHPGVEVNKYVVMPNHVHMILVLTQNDVSISTVVGSYKSYVSSHIHRFCPQITVWQKSFHDHVIRDQSGYEKIWLYIDANPNNWEKDCFYL